MLRELGGVAEWFKAHAWKACVRLRVPRVRIPPPPPVLSIRNLKGLDFILDRKFGPTFGPTP